MKIEIILVATIKRVLVVIGTRPEAIKMAPVVLEMKSKAKKFETVLCFSGQHPEMVEDVLDVFGLETNIRLNVFAPNQSLPSLSSRVVTSVSGQFEAARPDLVLVHGDTTTAYGAALAGFYNRIAVGHVEAGLRTHQVFSPFPEEFNRRSISLISQLNFAPTSLSRENLVREAVDPNTIHVVGNTIVDAVRVISTSTPEASKAVNSLKSRIEERLSPHGLPGLVIVTVHRRENIGKPLTNILGAIISLSTQFPNVTFLVPVHPNPEIFEPVHAMLEDIKNVVLVGPQSYPDFISYLAGADLVLTDSGGVQEEAVSLGKTVFVLREKSERPEGLKTGLMHILGTRAEDIVATVSRFLSTPKNTRAADALSVYGDGFASEKIARIVEEFLHEK